MLAEDYADDPITDINAQSQTETFKESQVSPFLLGFLDQIERENGEKEFLWK